MMLIVKPSDQTCVCVCVFTNLHINFTRPRNLALSSLSFYVTRIDPPKGGLMILITKTSDQTRQRGHIPSTCRVLRKS